MTDSISSACSPVSSGPKLSLRMHHDVSTINPAGREVSLLTTTITTMFASLASISIVCLTVQLVAVASLIRSCFFTKGYSISWMMKTTGIAKTS